MYVAARDRACDLPSLETDTLPTELSGPVEKVSFVKQFGADMWDHGPLYTMGTGVCH